MSPKETSGHESPSLFPEAFARSGAARGQKSSAPDGWIVANVDGGARGNPGPAGFGVYIRDAQGKPIAQLSEYLGHRTNNFAE
jgi:ribonuclease HI